MSDFILSAKQIENNWKRFREIVNNISPSRKEVMNRMYDELEERIVMAPASIYDYFHNAIPGGYVDHVLRVYDFSMETFEVWKKMGLIIDNFTLEELKFAAIHHDLGKSGMPGENRELYQTNKSEWHRKNQGKIYQINPNLGYMETTGRTFYLLNHYKISYSENEMIGIQLTDGMYNEANKPYLVSYDVDRKLRNNMGLILHHSDLMAARFEFERWAISSNKFDFNLNTVQGIRNTTMSNMEVKNNPLLSTFEKVFPEML